MVDVAFFDFAGILCVDNVVYVWVEAVVCIDVVDIDVQEGSSGGVEDGCSKCGGILLNGCCPSDLGTDEGLEQDNELGCCLCPDSRFGWEEVHKLQDGSTSAPQSYYESM